MIPAERCSCGKVRKVRRVEGQKERHGSWRPLPPSPAPPSLPRSRARRRRRILHSVLRAASHGEANAPVQDAVPSAGTHLHANCGLSAGLWRVWWKAAPSR